MGSWESEDSLPWGSFLPPGALVATAFAEVLAPALCFTPKPFTVCVQVLFLLIR